MKKQYPEEKYPHKSITDQIFKCAFAIHNRLGHSFHEKVNENALVKELVHCNLKVEQQETLRVNYGGEPIGDFVVRVLVEGEIIVEL